MLSVQRIANALVDVSVATKVPRSIVCAICISIRSTIVPVRSAYSFSNPRFGSDESSQVESSFIHGYSGILLGLVLLDTPLNQQIVQTALYGEPTAMEDLVAAMEEFATMHENEDRDEQTRLAELESTGMEGDDAPAQSEVAGKIWLMLKQLRSF